MIDGCRCAIGGGQGCHLVPFAEGYPYRKLSPAHLCETIPNRLTMRVRTARCRSPLYLSCHGLRLGTCTPAQSFLRCAS